MTEPLGTPAPPVVAAAIVTSHLGVLVGRRRDGTPPWTFPAGKVERGESREDAAVREAWEETGLRSALVMSSAAGFTCRPVSRSPVWQPRRPASWVSSVDEPAARRRAVRGRIAFGVMVPPVYQPCAEPALAS
jgi:8-oxo-dGTP pyrophosphatase MutT (NUDIX family)